jgi:membrane protein YdbS with pleckstrin-like domain
MSTTLEGVSEDLTRAAPSRLREPSERVSPRARWLWTVEAFIEGAVAVAVALLVSGPWDWFGFSLVWFVPFCVLAVAFVIGMPRWRYQVHRWEVTDTAVYTQRGWFDVERRIAPLSRVQTVDVHRGPISQLFRLSTVTVTTASAAGALKIEGLDAALAARIVDDVTSRTERETSDAT